MAQRFECMIFVGRGVSCSKALEVSAIVLTCASATSDKTSAGKNS